MNKGYRYMQSMRRDEGYNKFYFGYGTIKCLHHENCKNLHVEADE